MKKIVHRQIIGIVAVAALSSCYYYPAGGGAADAPPNMPYNPYADEKSGSVPVYHDTCIPPSSPPPVTPVIPQPAFTLGIALPPIIFGHRHHRHHH